MSVPRGRARKRTRGPSASSIVHLLKSLRRRAYRSPQEYYDKVSAAAEAVGNAAAALSHIEAAYLSAQPPSSHRKARTLEVTPTGDPRQDFSKIQAAIDNARPGDRILLKSGVFRSSGVVWIWKDLSIEGEIGAVIEGVVHEGGKVLADPAVNGGFVIVGGAMVEIRDLSFRHLYSAVASHGGFRRLVFEDNSCEDVYHSIYLSAQGKERSGLVARCNRILITSLNPMSSRCRFNFYEESHLFGFYCHGSITAVLEGNRLEVAELTGSQPFHVIGVFCSGGSALISDNFFKGWHAPITVHNSQSPMVTRNDIHGMCEDAEYKPIGIFLRNCGSPTVCSNTIMNRGLGTGAIGIAASGSSRGRILDNRITLSRDAGSGILIYKSHDLLVGQNTIRNRIGCPIGLFGNQSEDVTGNLIFGNTVEGRAEIKMAYASENTIIRSSGSPGNDAENALLGYGVKVSGEMPSRLDKEEMGRHQRIFDHIGRKVWPSVPEAYLSEGGNDEEEK